MIDTHIHLDFDAFDEDRDAMIARAAKAGVDRVINPSTDLEATDRALALASRYPGRVFVAAGVHPMCATGDVDRAVRGIESHLAHAAVVSVGEAGLDRFRLYHPIEDQHRFFTAQAELAHAHDYPLIVHCRDAFDDTYAVLERSGMLGPSTVMHCFSGDANDARPFIEAGCYLGFTANITYPKATAVREAGAVVPSDRLLVETDAPFLAPQGHRGKRNECAHVVAVAAKLAEVRGVSFDEVARLTTANAERLFRLPVHRPTD